MYQAEEKSQCFKSKGINHLKKCQNIPEPRKEDFWAEMEGKQDARVEVEGQFGKPEFFARWAFGVFSSAF